MSDDPSESSSSLPVRPRRRWYQFGLRSLFLLMTAVIGVLVLCRLYVEPYRQQREAMEVIQRLGGTFQTVEATSWQRQLFGADFQNITVVDLADCDHVAEYLPHVARLPYLETLLVGGEEFQDEQLRRLHLPALKTLVLDSAPVSAAAIAELRQRKSTASVYRSQRRAIAALRSMGVYVMTEGSDARRELPAIVSDDFFPEACRVGGASAPNLAIPRRPKVPAPPPNPTAQKAWSPLRHLHTLRWLTLVDASLDDEALESIRDLTALESLRLTNSSVTDRGLANVAGLEQLRWLYLDGTRVGDAGMAQLARLSRLTWLELDGTQVGDAGIARLQGLNVEYLSLCQTLVSDEGLKSLVAVPRLKHVRVEGAAVTPAGLDRFRAARPKCFVYPPAARTFRQL